MQRVPFPESVPDLTGDAEGSLVVLSSLQVLRLCAKGIAQTIEHIRFVTSILQLTGYQHGLLQVLDRFLIAVQLLVTFAYIA